MRKWSELEQYGLLCNAKDEIEPPEGFTIKIGNEKLFYEQVRIEKRKVEIIKDFDLTHSIKLMKKNDEPHQTEIILKYFFAWGPVIKKRIRKKLMENAGLYEKHNKHIAFKKIFDEQEAEKEMLGYLYEEAMNINERIMKSGINEKVRELMEEIL